MRFTLKVSHLLAAAAFIAGGVVCQAQAADAKAQASQDARNAAAAAKERAKSGPGGGSLQDLVRQLRENREAMIADHESLAKKLKDATEQEKKTIKEKMERQMKAFEEQQASLHRQIRDEQRRQRQEAVPGKR